MSTVVTTDFYYTSNTGNSMEFSDVGSNDISLVRGACLLKNSF